jgi:hypothetical protein
MAPGLSGTGQSVRSVATNGSWGQCGERGRRAVGILRDFRSLGSGRSGGSDPRSQHLSNRRTPGQDSRDSSFPYFVRGAYIWLLIAAGLSMWAVSGDWNGGIWGASRHALTVGFVSTMIFAIGQRILPAFCGMRTLFSKGLMFGSLALLNLGCFLRVAAARFSAYLGQIQGVGA